MLVGANVVMKGIAISYRWDRAESPVLVVALLVECLDAGPTLCCEKFVDFIVVPVVRYALKDVLFAFCCCCFSLCGR